MTGRATAKTILIIDDDEDFRAPLEIVLGANGYRTRCACDGDEGVRMATEEPPDLILLDFLMPGKNGFEALQELRELPQLQAVPILALTAFGQNIGEIYGMSSGTAPPNLRACLEKPVELNVLLRTVESALAVR